jgi:2-C-methyl-D-erythritol 4-phosphate cytidylyltransferase
MKKYAIIVAGGSGLRMGTSLPKQFLFVQGKTLLSYTVEVFLNAFADVQIIIVFPFGYEMEVSEVAGKIKSELPILWIMGGATRFHSVQKGLSLVAEDAVVFVHDAVRCLVTEELIRRCFENAIQYGSAVPCIDSKDSLRIVDGTGNRALKRSEIKLLQTPQTFLGKVILPAYQKDYDENFTDCASVVEKSNYAIHLIEGEINNIKITTPLDLLIAEKLLSSR